MRQLKNTLLAIVLGSLALPTIAAAAPPSILPIQGYVTDDSDLPLDGSFSVKFELWDAATNGASLYSTTIAALSISDGYFSVYLGDAGQTALDLSKFQTEDIVWLEISVGAETMTPRLQVGSVAFAAAATYCGDSDLLGGQAPAAFQARVSGTCTVAQKMIGINANGSAMCASDVDTTYTSGAGLALAGTAFSIAADGVTAAHIADNAVTVAQMADNSIGSAEVIIDSLGSADIAAGAITSSELAANAVSSANIVDGTIAAADLAANSVASANIVDGTIVAADLAANSVTLTQMADSAIGSAEVVDNSLTAADLATGSVTTDELNIPALYGSVAGTLVAGANYVMGITNLVVPTGSYCTIWSQVRISAATSPTSSVIYAAYNNGTSNGIFGSSTYFSPTAWSDYYVSYSSAAGSVSGTVDFGCYISATGGATGAAYLCKVNVACF
jgi:hypothetical protein